MNTPQTALDLHNAGRTHDAALMLDTLDPSLPVEQVRAMIASDIGRNDIAVQHWSNCALLKPGHHDFWYNWALCLDKCDRRGDAIERCEDALRRFPDSDQLWVLSGILTGNAECYRKALSINPDNATAMTNLAGFSCPTKALQLFRRAVELEPTNPHANTGLAYELFARGDIAAGWQHYEYRKMDYTASAVIHTTAKPWAEEPVSGKSFVVIGEQGIGDECMYLTGLEVLRGAKSVSVACEPRLVDYVQRAYPWASVTAHHSEKIGDTVQRTCEVDADYYLPCGDLWRYGNQRTNSLAVAEPMRFERPTVGICWRSGFGGRKPWPGIDWAVALVRDNPHRQFVNMQYGVTPDELAQLQAYDNFLNLDVDLYNDVGVNCEIALGCDYVLGPATAPMMFAKCSGANAVFCELSYWWRDMAGGMVTATDDEIKEILR